MIRFVICFMAMLVSVGLTGGVCYIIEQMVIYLAMDDYYPIVLIFALSVSVLSMIVNFFILCNRKEWQDWGAKDAWK